MTKYIVTGATGFMGSRLIDKLLQDPDNYIYAVVSQKQRELPKLPNIEYVVYDYTESSLEKAIKDSDYLIHFAAVCNRDETIPENVDEMILSNIAFSTHIFNTANRVNKSISIAIASTFSSLDERGNYYPETLYAATKAAVEKIAEYYRDLSIHVFTIPDTYGPLDPRPKVHNLLKHNTEWPFQFKSPSFQEIRLLHVEDVIGHILTAIKIKYRGVTYYDIYSTGILMTLKELKEKITDKECVFTEDAKLLPIPKEPRFESRTTNYKNKYTEFRVEDL